MSYPNALTLDRSHRTRFAVVSPPMSPAHFFFHAAAAAAAAGTGRQFFDVRTHVKHRNHRILHQIFVFNSLGVASRSMYNTALLTRIPSGSPRAHAAAPLCCDGNTRVERAPRCTHTPTPRRLCSRARNLSHRSGPLRRRSPGFRAASRQWRTPRC